MPTNRVRSILHHARMSLLFATMDKRSSRYFLVDDADRMAAHILRNLQVGAKWSNGL